MSGGVGPTYNDITLPQDQHQHQHQQQSRPTKANLLSLRQLNALAIIIILSASGMVSLQDHSFVIFTIFYALFLSKFAFPKLTPSDEPPVFGPKSKALTIYVTVGAIVGLFLPILYIFSGIYVGDKDGIKAAAPHLFLLAAQVFMEGVVWSPRFSVPIRVFVPVCYNGMRIFTLMEWLRDEFSKGTGDHRSWRVSVVGRGLAIANMGFWCFNLLGFLLPVYLPRAFKQYYSDHKVNKD